MSEYVEEKKVGRPSNSDKLNAIWYRSIMEFDKVQSALRDTRLQCLQDRRFCSVSGAQWEGPLQDQFANKPRFEADLIQIAIMKVFGEYRNNRFSVEFIPKDGSENKLSDACAGLYRADEQDSVAEEAHDNAFDEGVGGGYGAWRLRAIPEDEDNPDVYRQRVAIEPVFDADSSVYFNLDAKRQDKADAKRCWVLSSMTHEEYIDQWGDDIASIGKTVHQYEYDWATPDVVFVAEFYEVELKTITVFTYKHLDGTEEEYTSEDFEEDDELRETLDAIGAIQLKDEKKKTRKIHKYLMSGSRILEDCGVIAGKCIPVVPYYGKRWFVDNVERCSGVTRIPKDMQRLLNMQLSKLAETAALSPMEVPIFTAEQMIGHADQWASANIENYPYRLINAIKDVDGGKLPAGPVGYTKPPAIPPATAALLQITTELIRSLLGNHEQADKMVSNIAEKTVELVQIQIDKQAFIYLSNMAKAIKREGEIWLSMSKDLHVKEKLSKKVLDSHGKPSSIILNQPKVADGGGVVIENNLSDANFDVVASVGPSSQSKRANTVRNLLTMSSVTDDPETKTVLNSMIMMNLEGEGIEEVRDFFRNKLLMMGVVKPSEEEKQQLELARQNTPPDPQQKLVEGLTKQAEAEASNFNANTLKSLADTDLKTAQTAEVYAGIDHAETQLAIDAAQTFANVEIEQQRAALDRSKASGAPPQDGNRQP